MPDYCLVLIWIPFTLSPSAYEVEVYNCPFVIFEATSSPVYSIYISVHISLRILITCVKSCLITRKPAGI